MNDVSQTAHEEASRAARPPLVRFRRVSRSFDGGRVVAVRQVDLDIEAGECLAILGASGSGKSSLLNMMSGIDMPTSGTIDWNGKPVASRREWANLRGSGIGIVFQDFNLLPTLTALENVELATFGRGLPAAEREERARTALTRVGLNARLDHQPHALSGGERQRVAIARAIVNAPQLILADEPTGNLDSANAALVTDLLFDLQHAPGTTLVLVSHDEALARRCRRCIHVRDGQIVEDTSRSANERTREQAG